MMRPGAWLGSIVLPLALVVSGPAAGQEPADSAAAESTPQVPGLLESLDSLRAGLAATSRLASSGDAAGASRTALRLYLDIYEGIEAVYGVGAVRTAPDLSPLVTEGEAWFHRLMVGGDAAVLAAEADSLADHVARIEQVARASGVPLGPVVLPLASAGGGGAPGEVPADAMLRTSEIRGIAELAQRARDSYAAGHDAEALGLVEQAYLEGFEPLEARLPAGIVRRIESLIHLQLRPQIAGGEPVETVTAGFDALHQALLAADSELGAGSFGFGAFNAFVIILREGLEAVLLIGAILAYLSATQAGSEHHRRVYLGTALGVAASLATWVLARTLIPVSGANRELIEGITALIAVGVLLYVSNWLFQKSYIHDWKNYIREQVGRAVTRGSTFAMAGLAFAAVYREGFETVLFYQALMSDTGTGAVLSGFVPGMLLITIVGVAIVRLGVRLPLRTVFSVTNAILLYLAFVFLGKGLYNLQEAGLFSPAPVSWLPDSEALRQVLGFYPIAQTILAQAVFITMIVATYLVYRRRLRRAPSTAGA